MVDALARLRGRKAAKTMAGLPTNRTCAGCDACCTNIPIKETAKPGGVACQHLCGDPGQSCSIYEKRPNVCRTFACVWRGSDWHLPEWANPAKIGWVLTINDPFTWPLVVTAHRDPKRPDAWRSLWSQTVLQTIAEHWNCIVAIDSAPECIAVVAPRGGMFTREQAPELFLENDVGLPEELFGPDRTLPARKIVETRFDWRHLPPPPL